MNADTVAIAVAGLTTLAGGWQYLSNRKLAKSNDEKDKRLADLEKHKVESQAYDRARQHYDAIIDDLMKHVEWLKQELADTKNENERLRSRIDALEKTIEALRNASVIVIEPSDNGG